MEIYNQKEIDLIRQRLKDLPDHHPLKTEALSQLQKLQLSQKSELPVKEKEIKNYQREFAEYRKYLLKNFGWRTPSYYQIRYWFILFAYGLTFALLLRVFNLRIETPQVIIASMLLSVVTVVVWFFIDKKRKRVLL